LKRSTSSSVWVSGGIEFAPGAEPATQVLKRPVTPDDEAGRQTGKTCDLAFGYGGGFGRIVPSDAAKESWFALKENRKTKLQGSRPSGPKILQFKIGQSPENRLTFSRLAVVHDRRPTGSIDSKMERPPRGGLSEIRSGVLIRWQP
jgi:hypothetical protein